MATTQTILSPQMVDGVLNLWAEGKDATTIVGRIGISKRTVRHVVMSARRRGDSRAAPHGKNVRYTVRLDQHRQLIADLVNQGLPFERVILRTGLVATSAHKLLAEAVSLGMIHEGRLDAQAGMERRLAAEYGIRVMRIRMADRCPRNSTEMGGVVDISLPKISIQEVSL